MTTGPFGGCSINLRNIFVLGELEVVCSMDVESFRITRVGRSSRLLGIESFRITRVGRSFRLLGIESVRITRVGRSSIGYWV